MRLLVVMSVLIAVAAVVHADTGPKALVVKESVGGTGFAGPVAEQISAAGYDVQQVDAGQLDAVLKPPVDLLVLVDSAHLPASVGRPIQAFLENGGNIIALRAPLWQTPLVRLVDKWVSADEYQKSTATVPPQHVLFEFKPAGQLNWTRAANDISSPSTFEPGDPGPSSGTYSMHARISNLTGWDNIGVRDLDHPFPKGHTLTVFSAKGGPNTSQIAVEWAEKDGSRWIAAVPVDGNWRRYVLKPEDFKFWTSNPARGFRGDRLKPENASFFSFGLAFTHTGTVGGEHEFWIGPVGTADASQEGGVQPSKPDSKPMDLLYPGYKFFECTGVASVTSANGERLPAAGQLLSPQPRPEGRGFGKGRDWRFISLAVARTAKGEWRGTPAAMMVHSPGSPWKGGVWTAFEWQEPSAYKDPAVLSLIRQSAERVRTGLFLLEAGTDFFTYFRNQPMKVGANVLSLSSSEVGGVSVRETLTESGGGRSIWSTERTVQLTAGSGTVNDNVMLMPKQGTYTWPKDGLVYRCQLVRDNRVIDEISHEVHQWNPKPKKHFVTTKDGEFIMDGKPWKAHGVNYMPSSGIGTEDGEYFEHWIGARAYDPVIIHRDLEHIRDLGLNAVSVFVYSGHHLAGNVLDLLRQCEDLGIKVNLSLRPGTPMDFLWDQIRPIIERDRLWENDTVFAYDLAWEPSFGGHDARKKWDGEWENWIKERYGSVEKAEADWGYPVPREDGKITNPSNAQTVTNGEWHRMVVAYRRFLDDLLYEKYNTARTLVKSVDPNHLVSFRMSEAGNPTYNWDGFVPYEFAELSAAVDILEPEAYGRISDKWEKVRPGWFERAYARWADPEKPMMWAEMGVSSWDNSWMRNAPERLEYQADYFELFYKMMIDSGANGVFFWWYPGGFRYGENSDFGIINPDGSDRAVTKVIRRNAKPFLSAPMPPKPDAWIEVTRDSDPRGIFGVYEQAGDEFWKLIDEGKTPGLKTSGTGTTSADCPLVVVGDTRYHGEGPLKYLNAAFDELEIQDAEGKWVEVEDGTEVVVDRNKPVIARAVVRNLGEARWLSGDKDGSVQLTCHIGFGKEFTPVPHDVPTHRTISIENAQIAGKGLGGATTVHIYMRAKNRAEFGDVMRVRLVPGG